MKLDILSGKIDTARWSASPNYDKRESHNSPEVAIVHSISLPPGEYHGDAIERFFCNKLEPKDHPYFAEIAHLTVSSHFLIRRSGELIQFVSTLDRAWHAGESVCFEKPKVNDFSIGIELEGLDEGCDGYAQEQYNSLNQLLSAVREAYPEINAQRVFAHSDIAPERKIDPGPYFDWQKIDF